MTLDHPVGNKTSGLLPTLNDTEGATLKCTVFHRDNALPSGFHKQVVSIPERSLASPAWQEETIA